jgi:hypothetical protein
LWSLYPRLCGPALRRRRNDTYIREDDVDVKAVVAETLRQRGFGAAEDDAMDVS